MFWARRAFRLALAVVMLVGLASIWFNDPYRLATALGLVTAGLTFALQKVVTVVASQTVDIVGLPPLVKKEGKESNHA